MAAPNESDDRTRFVNLSCNEVPSRAAKLRRGTLISAGCARSLKLRAIDAACGSALSGVRVNAEHWGQFVYFYRTRHIHAVGSTDTSGEIMVKEIGPNRRLYFQMEGYSPAMLIMDKRRRLEVGWYILPTALDQQPPPVGPYKLQGLCVTNSADTSIIIPMTARRNLPTETRP